MAMTEITVTTSLATTAVVALSGVNRIRADNMVQGDYVAIYEENVAGDGYLPTTVDNKALRILPENPTIIFEGYGNYKFLISAAGIEVGYVAG